MNALASKTRAEQPFFRPDGFILIVQDQRGLVFIEHSENASIQLHTMMNDGLQIENRHVHKVFSPHAREIVLSLRQQFREKRQIGLDCAHWFAIGWEEATTALEDWDVNYGWITRAGDLRVGQMVTVEMDKSAVGTVRAFRQEGTLRKVRVAFATAARCNGVDYLAVWAPLSLVKMLPGPVGRPA